MHSTEKLFDINKVLKNIFISLKPLSKEKNIELIYEMGTGIPRELRGDKANVEKLFSTILTFIFQNTNQKEILLSLEAPEDFLYEENISFKIINTSIPKEKILAFLETGLGNTLQTLSGKVLNHKDIDIYIDIPFTIGELGFRRHYRLPTKFMLDKKILLMIKGENLGRSITNMFKYFPYDVDVTYTDNNIDLSAYNLVIAEESLITESFTNKVQAIQETQNLKFVILGTGELLVNTSEAIISTHLLKPVTQESIFELIISLFDTDARPLKVKPSSSESVPIQDQEDTISESKISISQNDNKENSPLSHMIEAKKAKQAVVLNTKQGLKNAQKMGINYSDILNEFLDNFGKSDLYFRQIANEKSTHKIKEFCIDLEKQAKIIGAESVINFTNIVSLIFVYNKLDMLPIYPGRYHIELKKLTAEIKKYLHIR